MTLNLCSAKPRLLKTAIIARDGSCMFGTIVHQLSMHKINSNEHIQATQELRKSVVEHISRHNTSFEFAIQGRFYDNINPESIKDLSKECKVILKEYLHMDYYWGGPETLKAVQEPCEYFDLQ